MNRPLLLIALSLALMFQKTGRAGDWAQRSVSLPRPTAMPPSHQWFPADFLDLVYDSWRRVTVGLGGYANPPLYYLAVSEYDGVNWVSRYTGSASNTPTFRKVGGATFDSWRGVTVVFGGWIGSSENSNNELWEYNGNQWTQRTWSGPGPRNSSSAQLCFDPFRGRTICLTGSPLPNTYETWEWTGSAWDRAPDLSGVGGVAMVFDESRNRAFVYTNEPLNGYWEEAYEFIPGATAAQGVWQHVPGDVTSVATLGASLVYDPYRQRVLRHGGRSAADIYAYEIGTFAWNPATARWNIVGDLPGSGRGGAGICYDRHRVMTVLYGGIRIYVEEGVVRTTQYADTWEYTDNVPGDTWVDFAYAGVETGSPQQPLNTLSEALTYAPPSGRIYLKSGSSPQTLNSAAFRSTPVTIYAWEGSATIGN